MQKHMIFPEGALRSAWYKTTYGMKDVIALRTSVHYSDSVANGSLYTHNAAVAYATRNERDTFDIHVYRSSVTEDAFNNIISMGSGRHKERPCDTQGIKGIPEDRILSRLWAFETQLSKEEGVFASKEFLDKNHFLNLSQYIHFRAASWLCNGCMTDKDLRFKKKDVLYSQQLLAS